MVNVLKNFVHQKFCKQCSYANNVDPDQTAPEGAVWLMSTLFAIQPSILRKNCIKSKIYAKKVWNNRIFTVHILGEL